MWIVQPVCDFTSTDFTLNVSDQKCCHKLKTSKKIECLTSILSGNQRDEEANAAFKGNNLNVENEKNPDAFSVYIVVNRCIWQRWCFYTTYNGDNNHYCKICMKSPIIYCNNNIDTSSCTPFLFSLLLNFL